MHLKVKALNFLQRASKSNCIERTTYFVKRKVKEQIKIEIKEVKFKSQKIDTW